MKALKLLSFSVLVLFSFTLHLSAQEWERTPQVPSALLQLLEVTEVVHDGTIEDVCRQTQKQWLRKAGSERWENPDIVEVEKRQAILELCSKLGFIDQCLPQKARYQSCVILGATAPAMNSRLNFAYKMWSSGIRFSSLTFLTGDRALSTHAESKLIDLGFKNECEAARYVYEHADLSDEFRKIPVIFVETPAKMLDGKFVRPTTRDTIETWGSLYEVGQNYLFVSNQPYVLYQKAAIESVIFTNGDIEVIGDGADLSNLHVSNMLDTVARWIYAQSKGI